MAQITKLPSQRVAFRDVPAGVCDMNDHAALQLCDNRHYEAAIALTKRAIRVTPNSKELWSNLSSYFWHSHQIEEGIAAAERAAAIDPCYYLPQANLGLLYADLHQFDKAEEYYQRAMDLNPEHLGATWCRSLTRLLQGDYIGGFKDYESRIIFRKQRGKSVYPASFPAPFWKGESLSGKTIYVASEQGIGDTIMFSRWLPLLSEIAGKVYVNCSEAVTNLLWEYRQLVEFIPQGVPIPEADYAVLMGSLPHYFGNSIESLPADPGLILRRAERQKVVAPAELPNPRGLGEPYRVGICWSGNPEQERNWERSIPFELMLEFTAHPRVWVYSFQCGPASRDIVRAGAESLVCDLSPHLESRGLAVTAEALLRMDAVVTCCTSIAHLSGALGIPATVLLCAEPYWVWGLAESPVQKDRSPWYPSLKLRRQSKLGDWAATVKGAAEEIYELAERHALEASEFEAATRGEVSNG